MKKISSHADGRIETKKRIIRILDLWLEKAEGISIDRGKDTIQVLLMYWLYCEKLEQNSGQAIHCVAEPAINEFLDILGILDK